MLLPAHHAGTVRRASTMADAQNTLGNSRISHMLETGTPSTRGIGTSIDAHDQESGRDTPPPERGRTAGTARGALSSGSIAQPFAQRLRSDFQVGGHISKTTSHWAYFDRASSRLTDDQRRNVELFSAGLSGPSQPVTLIGLASEEGDPGFNARLTDMRIDAVAQILIGRGHDAAAITRIPRPTASRGRIQYRRWRAVEMLSGAGARSSVPDCSREGPSQPFGGTEARDFRQDLSRAAALVRETAQELRSGRLSRNTKRAVRRLFGTGADLHRIAGGLDQIETVLNSLTPGNTTRGTRCHPSCQGTWKAFSSNNHLTICPPYFQLRDRQQRMRILIHEASHFDSRLGTADRAYGWERLIDELGRVDPEAAYANAASYALLVMLGHGVVGLPSSAPPEDDVSALPARLRRPVRIAIAYMQRWITSATDVCQGLYRLINEGIAARRWTAQDARREMRYVAGQFSLSFNARRPRDRDRSAVAAIYDRFAIMLRFLRHSSLHFTESRADTSWESGPGPHVAVAPSLGRRPLISRVRLLLRRLATATPDIRRGLESAYTNVADRFRRLKGDGP